MEANMLGVGRLKEDALLVGRVIRYFTTSDTIAVIFHQDWCPGSQFTFLHNGVHITEERAIELVGL